MFIKCNFSTNYNDGSLTILIELLKFRTNSRIIATYPGNLLWKMWIWVFEYYAMLFFFRSSLARHGWKVPYRKTNRSKNSKATLKHAPTWKLTEEKMWKLSLQIPRIDLHHILQLIIRICFLLDYLLFLRFLLLIWACIYLLEKILHKNYCCSYPKMPCTANKYLLKVSGRNPKARGEIC